MMRSLVRRAALVAAGLVVFSTVAVADIDPDDYCHHVRDTVQGAKDLIADLKLGIATDIVSEPDGDGIHVDVYWNTPGCTTPNERAAQIAEIEAEITRLRADLEVLLEQDDDEEALQAEQEIHDLQDDIDRIQGDIETGGTDLGVLESEIAGAEQESAAASEDRHVADNAVTGGDPVRLATGVFVHSETDISFAFEGLEVAARRDYSSDRQIAGSFGPGWLFTYDTRIIRGEKPEAAAAAALALSWAAFPAELQARLSALFDRYLGNPEASTVGSAEAQLAEVRRMQQEVDALAVSLRETLDDARETGEQSLIADAERVYDDAVGLKASVDATVSRLETAIVDLRSQRSEIDSIPAEGAYVQEIAELAENQRRLSEQSASANRYVVQPEAPAWHTETGLGSIILINENGSPRRFVLDAQPDYGSSARNPDGTTNFYPAGSTATVQFPGEDALRLLPDGSWLYTDEAGAEYRYDYYGRLTSIEDRNDNAVRFVYQNERLARVIDSYGRELVITRRPDGRVTSIDGPEGRSVEYGYDSEARLSYRIDAGGDRVDYLYVENRLVRMTKPDGSYREYNYEEHDGRWVAVRTEDEERYAEHFRYYDGYTEHENPSGIVERHFFDERYRTTRIEYEGGVSVQMRYDDEDNLVERIDGKGQSWVYEHDGQGNLTYARDPLGNEQRWIYNEFAQALTYTDAELHTTHFIYDPRGNLTEISYPDGASESFAHDERGRLLSWTDRRRQTTGYTYDAHGNPSSVSRPDGTTWGFTYDAYGNRTGEIDPNGNQSVYTYNTDNQVTDIRYPPGGGSEHFEYDNRKDLVLYSDRRGKQTRLDYDDRHLLRLIVNPLGETVANESRADGLLEQTVIDGATTIGYRYDRRGNPESETVVQTGSTTGYQYDERDQLSRVVGPRGYATDYEYDAAGRLERVIDAHQTPETFDYYPDGQLRYRTDRRGYATEYRYDELNRLTAVFDQLHVPHSYSYDPGGLLDFEIDRAGEVWDYEYDEVGRLVRAEVPGGAFAAYRYDDRGLLESYRDLAGAVTEYTYDDVGRLETESVPGTGSRWVFGYDPAGNRTSVENPNGYTTGYRYDDINRVSEIIDPAGAVASYSYDHLGNIDRYVDRERNLWEFIYDEGGRLRVALNPMREATRYTPDAAGNVVEIADPLDRVTSYGYDELDRLQRVTDNAGGTYRYEYDQNGNLTREYDPNEVAHSWRYDERGLPSGETNRLGYSATYEYDSRGNLIYEQSFSGEVTTYEYDARSRLEAKLLPGGGIERYGYDQAGRLTRAENRDATLQFAYDPAGRLTRAENLTLSEAFGYTYDAAGNRLTATREASGRTTVYDYGVRGELTAVVDPDGNRTSFGYDAELRETLRELPNGISVRSAYDPAGRLLSIAPSAFANDERYPARGYVYNAAGQITARVDESGAIRAYGYDQAGRLASVQYPYDEEKKREDLIEHIRLGLIAPATGDGASGDGPPPWAHGGADDGYDETDDLIPEALQAILDTDPAMLAGAHPVSPESTPFASPLRLGGQEGALSVRLREIAGPQTSVQTDEYVWTEEFSYDSRANRTEVRNGWGAISYAYDAANRTTRAGQRSYEHDRDGNLIRETLGNWNLLYRYDGENRVVGAEGELLGWADEGPQPERINYTYDALGRRTSRAVDYRQGFETGGVDTLYLYDGRSLSVAAELREIKLPGGGFLPPGLIDKGGPPGLGGDLPPGLGGDNPGRGRGRPGELPPPFQDPDSSVDEYSAREYVLIGSQILSHTDLVSRPVHNRQTSWYHADVRGSTMMLTGENAQVWAAYSYDAYGSVYGERPVVGVPRPVVPETARPAVERGTEYLYTGSRLEAETGQYDYGLRDYATRLARFTSEDPIRDGRNWYAYVGGDPVNRVDLWGLSASDLDGRRVDNQALGIGVLVAGGVGLFAGGGVPAAIVMAGGAILYTTPDNDPRSAFRIVAEAVADMFTPAVLPLSESLESELEEEFGSQPAGNSQ